MADLGVSLRDITNQVDEEDQAAVARIAEGVADKPTFSQDKNRAMARKPKPPPVVRDGFSMPEADYRLIEQATQRIISLGLLPARQAANKSLVLRAALHALTDLDDAALEAVLDKVPPLQAGRRG